MLLSSYEELSSDDLLTRCLGEYTQNSNKNFNALVWSMAPKSISSGKTVLDIAVYLAVIVLNDALFSVMQVMKQLSITIGQNCYNFCLKADATRIKQSERSLTDEVKEAQHRQGRMKLNIVKEG